MFKHIKSFLSGFGTLSNQNNQSHERRCDPHMLFFELIKIWPEIVGQTLASHTIPLKNVQKTLTILTDHPQWAQELSFMESKIKKQILKKIPALYYEIQKIKFQSDNLYFQNRDTPPCKIQSIKEIIKAPRNNLHPFSPEHQAYKKEANDLFQGVDDEETKELLTSIFINHKHHNKKSS